MTVAPVVSKLVAAWLNSAWSATASSHSAAGTSSMRAPWRGHSRTARPIPPATRPVSTPWPAKVASARSAPPGISANGP